MDRWDKIIKNKVGESRPYAPEAKWDKMAAMLDKELPVEPVPIPLKFISYKKWAWAASFLLIGFTTATLLWWSLDRKAVPENLWVEDTIINEESDCEEAPLAPYTQPEVKNFSSETREEPTKTDTKNLRLFSPTKKIMTEDLEENTPLISPQGKYRGVALADQVEEVGKTAKTQLFPSIEKTESLLASTNETNAIESYISNKLEGQIAPHIVLPSVPDKKLKIGKVNLNVSKAKREITKYASISKDAVSLALGPGVKKKWASHKWGAEFQLSLNHLPKRKAYYSIDNEIFEYSYTPTTPGVVLNLHRRLNPRWEVGVSGGIDGIWFPLEATPGNVNDYTEIWGTGYALSGFGKRHFRKNPEKRFRPYMIGSIGTYVMDLGLGRFQEFTILEENPSSWTSRKKAPEEATQQFNFEYESQPIKYSYLTGSVGTGVNIRLYRRFSINYQVALSGNVLVREETSPDVTDYWGFNHQWRQMMGVAMSF